MLQHLTQTPPPVPAAPPMPEPVAVPTAKAVKSVSVIIAAHNEEAVLGSCLDALLAQPEAATMQIIVSANGCSDRTVEVALGRGVTVVDRSEPGKPGALNAAEDIAVAERRIYLDADIIVPAGGIAAVLERLDAASAPLAVVPRRRISTVGRPLPVKAYFAINERLPVFRKGLFGRGMIALSGEGRDRFTTFPTMVADDLFIDSQFDDAEKAEASDVAVMVEAPFTTKALVKRLVRVRRGNREMRAASAVGEVEVAVRSSDKWAWLRDVVRPEPVLVFAAVPYMAITVLAAVLAKRAPAAGNAWGRDESTRTAAPEARYIEAV